MRRNAPGVDLIPGGRQFTIIDDVAGVRAVYWLILLAGP
jgi:hypothetical protein